MKFKVALFFSAIALTIFAWLAFVTFFSYYMDSWFTGITLGTLIYSTIWLAFYGTIMFFLGDTKLKLKLVALAVYSIALFLMKIDFSKCFYVVLSAAILGSYELAKDMDKKKIEMNAKKYFTKTNIIIYIVLSSSIAISLFIWVLIEYKDLPMAIYSILLGFIIGIFYWPVYAMLLYAKGFYQSITQQE